MGLGWPYFMSIQVYLPIIIIVMVVFFFQIFHQFNRERVIPLRWPVVGMLPGLLANLHRMHDYLTDALRTSGCTVEFKGPWLMGIDFVFTCDPANAKHLYTANFSNYPKGPEFTDIFRDIFGSGMLAVDGDLWSKQRKMANTHMSTHSFRSSVAEYSRYKVEKSALPLLVKMADLDRSFDLQDFLQRFTLDVVSKLIAGTDPGCLADDSSSVPFMAAVGYMEEVLLYRHIVPRVWWKMLRWLRVGEEKKVIMARKEIDQFIAHCIDKKRREEKYEGRVQDLLASYMYRSLDDREGHSYFSTDDFLRDTLATFLAAGTNAQATALSWFFWLLSKYPNVESKILEELKRSCPSEPVVDDIIVFDVDATEGMLYLHAALLETLRLYPSIPLNHKMAVEEDVLPSGHRVSPGTMVIFSAYSTGRMERFWGEDCREFKPERWIDSPNRRLKHVHSHEFLAFHIGPRTCVGKTMALTLMKIIAATMVYNFHFEIVKSCVVEPRIATILQMKNGLQVKVRKRDGSLY